MLKTNKTDRHLEVSFFLFSKYHYSLLLYRFYYFSCLVINKLLVPLDFNRTGQVWTGDSLCHTLSAPKKYK